MTNSRVQNGQALVETVVVATLLVVVFLLLIFLGKLADIRWHSTLAARTLAFDCAASVTRCKDLSLDSSTVDDLRRRHFMDPRRDILANDGPDVQPSATELKPFWNDRKGVALFDSMNDVSAAVVPMNFNAWEGALKRLAKNGGGSVGKYVDEIMEMGPERFGLKLNDGLIRARVQTELAKGGPGNFATQLDRLALKMAAQTAIFSDDWAASGPGDNPAIPVVPETSVAIRVNRGKDVPYISQVVDLAYLPIKALMQVFHALQLEPNGNKFNYHVVDMDLIPEDRISQ
jgi:hypothetical protein